MRLLNDVLMFTDGDDCFVLILLDISSVFDTVEHHILIKKLRDWVHITGSVLDWFPSYFTDRSFIVAIGNFVLWCPSGLLGPVTWLTWDRLLTDFIFKSFICR